ncbi:LysR family transcriptional regulator [Williamsia sp.]|uniref:LysR family transcriptional regulator n=1 Tax=Williamsia sp. TaxID=1872085 RepID=UPI001A333563|nr:LysR family transcriptional regulator [Williamsia sp.]MBJ7289818.1 LysR family transcriptional regulator [Williamsia sp.]
MDISISGLRVLREVAERGTFTAAAHALGYTQSGISRQVAALETAAHTRLFDRVPGGVVLTSAGSRLLPHAARVLDEMDAAERTLRGPSPTEHTIRLGMFFSAGAVLVPRALAALSRNRPDIAVTTREGSSPALIRAVRAGSLDAAVVTSRPPHRPLDSESPGLTVTTLAEVTLMVAVAASGPLGDRESLTRAELMDQRWIAAPSRTDEPLLGAWPSLPGKPHVAHVARDWMTKSSLVAAGLGVTTVASNMTDALPVGVRLVRVADGPTEVRRIVLAHRADSAEPAIEAMTDALTDPAA